MSAARTWVALVHHPVYDRNRRVVSTALTNLDLHDIARSTRTYGLGGYYIVHPVEAQRELAGRIVGHWMQGEGAEYNDFRRQAIAGVGVVATLADASAAIEATTGQKPLWVATAARPGERMVPPSGLAAAAAGRPILIVLGTGWGLTDEVLAQCEARLPPVAARQDTGYNHLSVRSACAILLDRLYGDREDALLSEPGKRRL